MNRLALILFILVLVGCTNLGDINRNEQLPVEMGDSLASDAIKELQILYPPAKTQFNIGQTIQKPDSFGSSLVAKMREKGYAVQEVNPTQAKGASTGIAFHYTVDRPVSSVYPGLYRVKLIVGKAILTRAYMAQNNLAIPAGAWAKME